jgi:NADH:ubiquinone oxidoreductase subunit F (NADH-binding)
MVARGTDAGSSALITVWGSDRGLAVFDLPLGKSLGDALAMVGVDTGTLRAVLVGGYFGSWLDPAKDQAAILGKDVSLGAGVIALLDGAHCGVAESSRVLTYLAGESAQQCGPCMFGLPAMSRALAEIWSGHARPAQVERLKVWAQELPGRGACHHPDGASSFTASALNVFAREVNIHVQRGRCARCDATPLLPVPNSRGPR